MNKKACLFKFDCLGTGSAEQRVDPFACMAQEDEEPVRKINAKEANKGQLREFRHDAKKTQAQKAAERTELGPGTTKHGPQGQV